MPVADPVAEHLAAGTLPNGTLVRALRDAARNAANSGRFVDPAGRASSRLDWLAWTVATRTTCL
jgi:hypothetical protein